MARPRIGGRGQTTGGCFRLGFCCLHPYSSEKSWISLHIPSSREHPYKKHRLIGIIFWSAIASIRLSKSGVLGERRSFFSPNQPTHELIGTHGSGIPGSVGVWVRVSHPQSGLAYGRAAA